MTLLTIIQDTLNEIGGFEVPTSIVGNVNVTATQSLALANRALKQAAIDLEWPEITVRATLTTVASQEEYAFPSDFKELINQTMWDFTNKRPMIGPVDGSKWEFLKNSTISDPSSITRWFRIFKSTTDNTSKIYVFPIPDSVATLRYEYVSKGLTQTSSGVIQDQKYVADTDTALLDEDLIAVGFKWRFLHANGLPYAEEFRDYEEYLESAKAQKGAPIVDLASDRLRRERVFIVQEGDFPG